MLGWGAFAAVTTTASPGRSHDASAPVVATAAGRVRGTVDRRVETFKGIPYGDTTAGERRYRAPNPAPSWTGVRDATRYGTIAPQIHLPLPADFQAILNYQEMAPPGEDCLRLNLWTPRSGRGQRRPVMVWFHGGGFSSGSGGIRLYDGANLAREQDVVVVTVNHRLASFGYLDFAWTGDPRFIGSGNAGNLDLILALNWVRENIAAFGGDPANVTLFGQSGGGAKVSSVMAMPAARGLFHKAIIQSGPMVRAYTADYAEARARAFLKLLDIGPDALDRLAEVPLERLYAAEQSVGHGLLGGWGPVVDGYTLPSHPFDPAAPAMAADIPLIIGWTAEETALFDAFLIRDPAFGALSDAELDLRTANLWGEGRMAMLRAYQLDHPGLANWDLWLKIKADSFAGADSIRLAERKALQRASVFVYELVWRSPVHGGRLKAFHGLDQPLVFNNLALSPGWAGVGVAAHALATQMSSAWGAFARSGSPQTPFLPHWPAYRAGARATMLFDDRCRVVEDPAPRVRAAWATQSPNSPI